MSRLMKLSVISLQKEYDRLCKSGFNFNNLKRNKIPKYKSLEGTNLSAWQGKETEKLVSNIYDKIKDIKIKYPRSKNSKKYDGSNEL